MAAQTQEARLNFEDLVAGALGQGGVGGRGPTGRDSRHFVAVDTTDRSNLVAVPIADIHVWLDASKVSFVHLGGPPFRAIGPLHSACHTLSGTVKVATAF